MMKYPSIQTIFKRDPRGNLLEGQFSLPVFSYLANNTWQFEEKIDGTNIRIIFENSTLRFGGRTDAASIPTFLLYKLQDMFTADILASVLREEEASLVLFGEGYGAKIQKGGGNYISDGVNFVLFDVNISGIWLDREQVKDIGVALGCVIAPRVGEGTLYDAIALVKEGLQSHWGQFEAEGLVIRPPVRLSDHRGNPIITKIKARDFVKKGGATPTPEENG